MRFLWRISGAQTMNAPETIEKSIFWQKYILINSTNSKQKERAQKAIEKLTQQLKERRP